MKYFTALFVLAQVALTASAQVSACHSDGCTSRRNAQSAAIQAFLKTGPNGDDGCESAESYLFSLARLSDSTFVAVCGDVDSRMAFKLVASPTNSNVDDGSYSVKIVSSRRLKN